MEEGNTVLASVDSTKAQSHCDICQTLGAQCFWKKKMTGQNPDKRNNVPRITLFLSVISLLADTAALAQLSFDIIKSRQPQNFTLQIIAVVLVFLLGLGLGALSARGGESEPIARVYRVFMWVYLVMACLSYLGIALQFRRPYTLSEYVGFVIVILLQVAAFLVLRHVTEIQSMAYALAPLTLGVIHALIFLFQLVFVGAPPLQYLLGEWMFWLAWLLFGALLLRSYKSTGESTRQPFSSMFRDR